MDMRPVDPNDFFRDRNEEWAVDEEEDANESLPRSMAVTDNLFGPDNEGEERKAELGFDSIQDEFQLDGDNDVVGSGESGSLAPTEMQSQNRASKRIHQDGDSNDDSDADEGEDKVGEMPTNHRAEIINKAARYGSAAVESSGPLQKVDPLSSYEANIQALVPDGSYNPLDSGGASRQRAPSVVNLRRTLLKKKQLNKR